jgi:hypothetical protein
MVLADILKSNKILKINRSEKNWLDGTESPRPWEVTVQQQIWPVLHAAQTGAMQRRTEQEIWPVLHAAQTGAMQRRTEQEEWRTDSGNVAEGQDNSAEDPPCAKSCRSRRAQIGRCRSRRAQIGRAVQQRRRRFDGAGLAVQIPTARRGGAATAAQIRRRGAQIRWQGAQI